MEVNALRLLKKQDDHPLESSKWIELPVLLAPQEMKTLIESLGSVSLFPISRPIDRKSLTDASDFLQEYQAYAQVVGSGLCPPMLQAYVMTLSLQTLYALELQEEKLLVRPYLPTIFVKPHSFIFSPLDLQFRSKVYGESSISWGYAFAYPQFCIDPTSHQPEKIDGRYVNTALFKQVQRWIREHTVPTPFTYQGQRINAPIRIGKGCFPWVKDHFQLKAQHLHVFG